MKKYINIILLLLIFMSCGVVEKLANKNPIIKSVTATPRQIGTQDTTSLRVEAEDPDGDMLSYQWDSKSIGELLSTTEQEVKWVAPNFSGRYRIEVKVTDENGGKTTGQVLVDVKGDESPIVTFIQPVEGEIITGIGKRTIEVEVTFNWQIERVDFFLDGDSLIFVDHVRPFKFTEWDVSHLAGQRMILARAYEKDNLSNFGEDSVHVYVEGVIPIPKH